MIEIIRHKRRATFRHRRATGIPLDDCTVTAQVRAGNTVTDLAALILFPARLGDIELSASAAQTSIWPTALMQADIRIVHANGEVTYSDTFYINVLDEVTQP